MTRIARIAPRLGLITLLIIIAGCAGVTDKRAELAMDKADYSALPGWTGDDMTGALQAFRRSCQGIDQHAPGKPLKQDAAQFGTYGDWQKVCDAALAMMPPLNQPKLARVFFKNHFAPHRIRTKAGKKSGLFTGYFEPVLNGATTRHGEYQTPLRLRPDDLVMVHLGQFRDDLKGRRIAGRVVDGTLKPYETRREIIQGELPNDEKWRFVYVDDAIDAFFLQVQGSGRIRLGNGDIMRVGYAGQNGHSYTSIGKKLIKRGALEKDNVSLRTIRQWLQANPDKADAVMNANKSYVFFKKLEDKGPMGAEGVALTPKRSLAVDHSYYPYGMPFFLDAEHPDSTKSRFQRLMIGQDTGGAIRGVIRGDVFWGHGAYARKMAGNMTSQGRFWVLLPDMPEK